MSVQIAIVVNKRDKWLCRICVASIRYYYPNVKIYLIKDELNGKFSTREIEKRWNVQLIEYSVKRFGWGAAKMHFFCDQRFVGQKFLILDSDIVFTGKLLDQLFVKNFDQDIIVSEEYPVNPNTKWFTETYFDFNAIKEFDPTFSFVGFSFNTGQIFCKGRFLNREILEPYFDFNGAPSWKRMDIFPLVDQSVLNYLLPKMSVENKVNIGRQNFMLWSESKHVKTIPLDEIMCGERHPNVIHWAGALRIPLLYKMTRGDILDFFESYYYSQVRFGYLLKPIRKINPYIIFQLRILYRKLKKAYG